MKDTNDNLAMFVDLDLTKSEREAQYQLRLEKRSLETKYSDKAFVIRKGRVIEKWGLLPRYLTQTVKSILKCLLLNVKGILSLE